MWFHSPRYGSEHRDIDTSWPRPGGSLSQGTYNSRHLQNRDDSFQIIRDFVWYGALYPIPHSDEGRRMHAEWRIAFSLRGIVAGRLIDRAPHVWYDVQEASQT